MRLAERCGLPGLVAEQVQLTGAKNGGGRRGGAKVTSIVGGDGRRRGQHRRPGRAAARRDGRPVRRGAGPVHAGHVPARVHPRPCPPTRRGAPPVPGRTGRGTPRCCPAPTQVAFVDVDSTHRRVYGYAKQGAGYGRFKGVRTPAPAARHDLAPRIARAGDRRGPAAARARRPTPAAPRGFVAEALATARRGRRAPGLRIAARGLRSSTTPTSIAACRRAGRPLLGHRAA